MKNQHVVTCPLLYMLLEKSKYRRWLDKCSECTRVKWQNKFCFISLENEHFKNKTSFINTVALINHENSYFCHYIINNFSFWVHFLLQFELLTDDYKCIFPDTFDYSACPWEKLCNSEMCETEAKKLTDSVLFKKKVFRTLENSSSINTQNHVLLFIHVWLLCILSNENYLGLHSDGAVSSLCSEWGRVGFMPSWGF